MAMVFGIYCFFFTVLIGLPAHIIFYYLKVRSVTAYAIFGLLAGAAIVPILTGNFDKRSYSAMEIIGILGMLNATIFAVILKKLNAEPADAH